MRNGGSLGGMIENAGLGGRRGAGEAERGNKNTRGRRSAKKLEHIEIWSLPGGETLLSVLRGCPVNPRERPPLV